MENVIMNVEIKNVQLKKATAVVNKCVQSIAKNAYTIAAVLAKVDETECYTEDGFKNVAEYAEQVLGFKKSATYEYVKIGREYVENNHSNLPHTDVDFTHKQVAALLPLNDHNKAVELVNDGKITVDMSVADIKKIVKAEKATEDTADDTADEVTEETEDTADEVTEETEDTAAEIASALHDMRAAYSRFIELVKQHGIDPENAQNFADFVNTLNSTNT